MKHVAKVTKDIPASANIFQWPAQTVASKAAYINALFAHVGSLRTDDTANGGFFNSLVG
ncbi:MAG: hypothetical protein HZB26_11600 [Candidatus Hydrogenedentes bacterium]|nr:hypothetical protein [Candidatus Hydrogenedentota bacterium]